MNRIRLALTGSPFSSSGEKGWQQAVARLRLTSYAGTNDYLLSYIYRTSHRARSGVSSYLRCRIAYKSLIFGRLR